MNIRRLLALAALSFLAMSNSCKKEDDVVPCNASADVTSTQLAGFQASIIEPVPYVGQTNEYLVNSAEEYRALFAGKQLPAVDFARYTLLAGKTRTGSSYRLLAQQVTQTCTGYTYTVKLVPAPVASPACVVYYVLLPKLLPAAKVAFEVQLLAVGSDAGTASSAPR